MLDTRAHLGDRAPGVRLPFQRRCPRVVQNLLRAAADGPSVDHLLEGYSFLRGVEACNRWVAGRAEESLKLNSENIDVVAELVEPGLTPDALAMRLADVRQTVRSSYDAVIAAGTIRALNDLTS